MKKKSSNKKGSGKLVAGATVAGLAAAVVGYYFYGPNGKKRRAKLQSWTLQAQGEVMERIEKLKKLDRESYENVVDEVAKKYAKAKGVAAKEVVSFAKEVKEQWKHLDFKSRKKVASKKIAKKGVRIKK